MFSVPQQQQAQVTSAQLKSSVFKCTQKVKACHKAPANIITMNVSAGNSKEIFELFTNKLMFSESVSQG